MGLLLTQSQWTRQPQVPVGINWGNPFVRSPSIIELGGMPFNRVRGSFGSKNVPASETLGPQPYGMGASFTGNTLAGHLYVGQAALAPSECTFAGVFTWKSGAANNFPQLAGLTTDNSSWRVGASGAGGGDVQLIKGAAANTAVLSVTSDVPYFMIASGNVATSDNYVFLKNLYTGVITTNVVSNGTAVSNTSNTTSAVGIARTDFAGAWNGSVGMCYISRFYTPQALALATLALGPWQLFAPLPRRIWVGAAAAPGGFVPAWAFGSNTLVIGSGIHA